MREAVVAAIIDELERDTKGGLSVADAVRKGDPTSSSGPLMIDRIAERIADAVIAAQAKGKK